MSNKTWIIGTIIAGIIFYTLAGNVSKKAQKIANKDYTIVQNYTNLLSALEGN
jgi:Zn-dependent M32 family carboxypeptidase